MTCEISLENIEFFAYHGYYDEEQKIGNRYSVSICITASVAHAAQQDELQSTVNYEVVYKIAQQVMQKPTRLLEHLAYSMVLKLFKTFELIETATVAVRKHNPPIGGVCEAAQVKLTLNQAEYKISYA